MGRIALAVVVLYGGIALAVPPDPATLFPPDALAYAEVGHPAKTADALAELFKGTPLADTLTFSHDRRDTLSTDTQLQGLQAVQALGLCVSPELLADVRKLHAVSAALLGFDATTGRPRYAVVVQFGDATALPLMVRTYLTTSSNVRRVGKIGDTPVYQNRGLSGGQTDEEGKPRPVTDTIPPEDPHAPAFVYAPGLFVVGTGKAAVADVLARYKKPAADSLAVTLGKADRTRPGVSLWADGQRLEKEYALARRRSGEDLIPADWFAHLRFLLPAKALKPVSGHLKIEPDGFALHLNAEVADADAPLVALLSGGPTDAGSLRVCAGAVGGLSVSLPKEGRVKAVVKLADALAAAAGDTGMSPAERLAELTKGGFKAEAELFPQLKAVTVIPGDLPKRPLPSPPPSDKAEGQLQKPPAPQPPAVRTLVFTLESPDAAKAWQTALPQFARWVCKLDAPPATASEVVNGQTVFGMVIDHPAGRYTVYSCRNGDQFAVGVDRARVLAAASLDPTAKPPAIPEKGTDPAAFVFVRFDAVAGWVNDHLPALPPREVERPVPKVEIFNPGSDKTDDPPPKEEKSKPLTPEERLTKAFGQVPPLFATAGVKGKVLTATVRFRCDKKPLAELIEAWMTWAESAPVDEEHEREAFRGRGKDIRLRLPKMIGD